VSKNGLLLTSLVAASPGGLMACLMVMAFVNYAGGPTWWVKILAAMLLLIGVLLAAMPVGIFLFAGPKAEKAPGKEGEEAKEKAEAAGAESEAAAGTGGTDSSLEVEPADDSAMTSEFVAGDDDASGEDFDLGPGSEFEMEAAEADVEADEEEPRKGK
jgi:hypothetical protein